MTIHASAPGKLLLLGEYAVLGGAPALVAAVDRYAKVVIDAVPGGEIRLTAPDIGVEAVGVGGVIGSSGVIGSYGVIGSSGAAGIDWRMTRGDVADLALVDTVLAQSGALGESGASDRATGPSATGPSATGPSASGGMAITLDTAEFFDAAPAGSAADPESPSAGRIKIGIGSSAALTVALAGALAAHRDEPAPDLARLVILHRATQQGRGSGADVAAALHGGVVRYTDGGHPTAEAVSLPGDLHWCCVFTGRSSSTGAALARLADWSADHAAEHRSLMSALAEIASRGADAGQSGDASGLLAAVGEYVPALERLGAAAGIDIVSREHRELGNLAATCGVRYKPSGSGGGDIGVAFSGDADHIAAFRAAATAAGYRMMNVALAERGLSVTRPDGP